MALRNFNRIRFFSATLVLLVSGLPQARSGWILHVESFDQVLQLQDTVRSDTINQDSLDSLPYRSSKIPTYTQKDRFGDPFSSQQSPSPLLLKDPSTLKLDVEIDTGMNYTIYEKIGDINYKPASTMSFEEFSKIQEQRMIRNYWKTRSLGLDGESAVSGRKLIPPIYISPLFDRIFGGSYVDITPNGFVNLDFGGRWQRLDNPSIPIRQQRNGGFEFDQQISMNVTGKIGEKLSVLANFDNNNSFDFENDLKVEYTGFDEEIIKKIEFGNVSLPLNNSLISGAQSLFGVKTQLQFGKLFVTGVASTQRGQSDMIEIESGVQGREFEVRASDYDENRHFFLGHFFRQHYGIEPGQWLNLIPHVQSGVNITRVEVYLVNKNNSVEALRSIVAFMDLGEGGADKPTANTSNDLYNSVKDDPMVRDMDEVTSALASRGMEKGLHYEVISSARKLSETEYTFNPTLGYISLSRKLQSDEALAVSFEYTLNGQTYRVGELSDNYGDRGENELIILKLLRPAKINIDAPTWDLMMKNIYNLNAAQINPEGFELKIIYRDDNTGINNPSLHEGQMTKDVPLVQIMGLDQLNGSGVRQKDGNFDFIEGITVNPVTGQIIFPVTEPFGDHLRKSFAPQETNLVDKYVYDTLYNTTKSEAELETGKNKFFISGRFQSGSSSEIMLPGINISENSVRILAGNTPLVEGVDYRVDYNLGKVTILNQGVLNSGKKIMINYEKADLFNFQTRNLLGTRLDYRLHDDFNIGATMLYVNERPIVSRVNIGDEPTRNLQYGFDLNYRSDSRFLTRLVDALPFLSTKETSTITLNAEFAQLRPGTSNIVGGDGTSYIDDFEAAQLPFNMGNEPLNWAVASTPETTDNRFLIDDPLGHGYRRAKISWYTIDNIFYRESGPYLPPNITREDRENYYVTGFLPQELWNKSPDEVPINERIFDIAYFPNERGPYNYNPDFIMNAGTPWFVEPKLNWGGISRAITSDVDFDKNNIEYIEFWLMDPFSDDPVKGRVLDGVVNEPNRDGGLLYFNLGSVSEDVIPDNRHGFENGLPAETPPDQTKFDTTQWGRVTTQQYLTNAFDNSPSARENQDVGMDGLKNEDEKSFPNYPSKIRELDDPSADDFKYFLDPEYNEKDAKILERYKHFNGLERNSPVSDSRGNNSLPNNEDLNRDNTISDIEEYYEYKLDLRPGKMEIGSNNIVDKISAKGVDWYLVRIPIREPGRIHGNIQGFKSIRFIRMYLTDFNQPVVLRMARFQLVGSQWRRYNKSLSDGEFRNIPETDLSNMTVSVVGKEENGERSESKIPYVVPPGVKIDRDITSAIYKEVNEQALQICVDNLEDRDSRAAFKNVSLDLVNYGRVKMFFHAQSPNARDNEVSAFLRLGSDFTENYYEIEVPLKITPDGTVVPEEIWPEENEIDVPFEKLQEVKSARNRLSGKYSSSSENSSTNLSFSQQHGRYIITVVGNPTLNDIQSLMIGVKNPNSGRGDDEASKTVCIWANELRVANFNNEAGWAANARMNAKLADFANVTASTRYTSFGFGGIQQRIADRSREEITEFDVSANVNVDKMLPGNTGIKIPMYVSYETSKSTPKYDPRDPDILLSSALASFSSNEERGNYRDMAQNNIMRRSINFTNVRKEKLKEDAKPHFYDIENFSASYSYSDLIETGFERESFLYKSFRANLAYNFTIEPSFIEPFKNIGLLKSPYLQLIRDFNFSLTPSSISVRADLDRKFQKIQLRNSDLTTEGILPTYEKYFFFNRFYNVRWNLSRSLALEYRADANAVIDEGEGEITDEVKGEIINNLKNFGRMNHFRQTVSANYRVPFDKLPFTDWMSAELQYAGGYTWSGETVISDTISFGNLLQNNREQSVNAKLDMVKLYNKIKFLKDINSPVRRRPSPTGRQDTTAQRPDMKLVKGFARMLMGLRSINATYRLTEGTILPGYNQRPFLFGLDSGFNSPGLKFLLGSQDPSIRRKAAQNNWLVANPYMTTPFSQVRSEDLNLTGNIEPFQDLRIQISIKKTKSENYQEIFRINEGGSAFESLTPFRGGSYSISFLPIKTAFFKDDADNKSQVFQDFIENRTIVKNRLESMNSGEYSDKMQDVLIPAFLAAYTGRNAATGSLSPFPNIPMPNWRIDYRGLTNIGNLADIFSSINISHSYSSEYRINNFSASLDYQDPSRLEFKHRVEDYPLATPNQDGRLSPLYVVSQAVIIERFAPLVGVNITTRSRLQARIDYNRERNIALQISNGNVTELKSSDFTFSFGFTKTGLRLPFKVQGETIVLNNDLTFKTDLSIRDTRTLQRKMVEVDSLGQVRSDNIITSGNINFQLRPTISYVLNERLNLSCYFERNINEPRISSSFPRRASAFGFQVRFSLAQ